MIIDDLRKGFNSHGCHSVLLHDKLYQNFVTLFNKTAFMLSLFLRLRNQIWSVSDSLKGLQLRYQLMDLLPSSLKLLWAGFNFS